MVLRWDDPKAIERVGDSEVQLTWGDGHVSLYEAGYLRKVCPCAACTVEEMQSKSSQTVDSNPLRLVPAEQLPPHLTLQGIAHVGRYALHFDFSDGHATGIYPFEYLREVCPCQACRQAGGTKERSG